MTESDAGAGAEDKDQLAKVVELAEHNPERNRWPDEPEEVDEETDSA
jgi:hypothetical protein